MNEALPTADFSFLYKAGAGGSNRGSREAENKKDAAGAGAPDRGLRCMVSVS
jgi:hypothetical protein